MKFAIFFLILTMGLVRQSAALGQEEERVVDERAVMKEKIKELEKIIKERGSAGLEKELEDLKKLDRQISAEDDKAKQKRIEQKTYQLTQQAIGMQRKRIKEIEDKIDESLLPPEKLKEIEEYVSKEKIRQAEENLSPEVKREIESRIKNPVLPPERIKEIEQNMPEEKVSEIEQSFSSEKKTELNEEFDREKMTQEYICCRAVLENDVSLCDGLPQKDRIRDCPARFRLSLFSGFLDEVMANKKLTPKALDICRKLSSDISEDGCKLMAKACLTGDASGIAGMSSFEGWYPEAMALLSGNSKYCAGITSPEQLKNCRNNALYTSAMKAKSPSMCMDIEDDVVLKKICQLYFNRDEDICEDLLKN